MAGLDLVTRIENCGTNYTLSLNSNFDAGAISANNEITIDPRVSPTILTDQILTFQQASLLRIFAHELGHLAGKDDAPNPGPKMENVRAWENPVMYPIDGMKRIAY